ncbi:MAG: hypothetical protein ACREQA_00530 [Candidatus Binatia bacterium]
MESRINQLEKLLEQGKEFTFKNFSVRDDPLYRGNTDYGGKDSPQWLAWKTRVNNIIRDAVEENSSPDQLLVEAENLRTPIPAQAEAAASRAAPRGLQGGVRTPGDAVWNGPLGRPIDAPANRRHPI